MPALIPRADVESFTSRLNSILERAGAHAVSRGAYLDIVHPDFSAIVTLGAGHLTDGYGRHRSMTFTDLLFRVRGAVVRDGISVSGDAFDAAWHIRIAIEQELHL